MIDKADTKKDKSIVTNPAKQSPGISAAIARAVKEGLIAAIIAALLFVLLIGFKSDFVNGKGIVLVPRIMELLIIILIVFLGRFLLRLGLFYRSYRYNLIPDGEQTSSPSAQGLGFKSLKAGIASVYSSDNHLKKWLIFAGVLLVIALPFLVGFTGQQRYWVDLATVVLTYVMLGWGLNIVVGLAGLLDLGYVAFYAVGAYTYALISTRLMPYMIEAGWISDTFLLWAFWISLPIAGLSAALWGLTLGFPVLRLRGDYLAIVTLAFGEIIRIVLLNWVSLSGGPDGVSRIPRPTFFGIPFSRGDGGFADTFDLGYSPIHRIIFLYYLILALAFLTNYVTIRLRQLPVGRAWEALREDEIACRSLGINTRNVKLTAFTIGAMFGGFAGSFFATRQGFISPESFVFIESAIILSIVVLGGLGSQLGVLLAAVVMIGGFEVFREFENYRMLVFGLLMVVIMVWRPRGLISVRKPSIFLKKATLITSDTVSEGKG